MSSSTDMDKSWWGNDILWKSLHSSIQNKQQDLISASHVKLIQKGKNYVSEVLLLTVKVMENALEKHNWHKIT